jgi:hypothetical protein
VLYYYVSIRFSKCVRFFFFFFIASFSHVLDGITYTVGVVGLNNVKNNDHINVLLQMLGHIPTFRNYLLDQSLTKNYEKIGMICWLFLNMNVLFFFAFGFIYLFYFIYLFSYLFNVLI